MNGNPDKITLTGMRFYAFHGCLEWERQHGNDFQVDLECSLDLGKAAAVKEKFPQICSCAVTVTKFNPPYDGKYEPRGQGYASVTINC